MKLNSTQVKQTLSQMNAQVLPDDHPAVAQLTGMFGDHTFFLDESGLKVLAPTETPDRTEVPDNEAVSGQVVSIADWSDETLTSLTPHEPSPTDTVITFRQVRH